MKARVRAAWVIMAAVIALSLAGHIWVHRATERTILQLEDLAACARSGDYKKAGQKALKTAEDFDKCAHGLEMFMRREAVAEISVSLHGLSAYANRESLYDLCSEADKTIRQLRLLEHMYCTLF